MVQHADREMAQTVGNVFVKCLKRKCKNAEENSPGALLYLHRMYVHLMYNLYCK